jgi:hypothetical protein
MVPVAVGGVVEDIRNLTLDPLSGKGNRPGHRKKVRRRFLAGAGLKLSD